MIKINFKNYDEYNQCYAWLESLKASYPGTEKMQVNLITENATYPEETISEIIIPTLCQALGARVEIMPNMPIVSEQVAETVASEPVAVADVAEPVAETVVEENATESTLTPAEIILDNSEENVAKAEKEADMATPEPSEGIVEAAKRVAEEKIKDVNADIETEKTSKEPALDIEEIKKEFPIPDGDPVEIFKENWNKKMSESEAKIRKKITEKAEKEKDKEKAQKELEKNFKFFEMQLATYKEMTRVIFEYVDWKSSQDETFKNNLKMPWRQDLYKHFEEKIKEMLLPGTNCVPICGNEETHESILYDWIDAYFLEENAENNFYEKIAKERKDAIEKKKKDAENKKKEKEKKRKQKVAEINKVAKELALKDLEGKEDYEALDDKGKKSMVNKKTKEEKYQEKAKEEIKFKELKADFIAKKKTEIKKALENDEEFKKLSVTKQSKKLKEEASKLLNEEDLRKKAIELLRKEEAEDELSKDGFEPINEEETPFAKTAEKKKAEANSDLEGQMSFF